MLHLWVIALFVALVLRDSLDAPLLTGWLPDRGVALVTVGSMVLICLVAHVVIRRCTRVLGIHGSWRAVVLAESTLGASRWAAVAVHLAGVLLLGWLDVIRGFLGDLVVIDEAVAIAPPLLVFASGWWSIWPIERMLHDATVVRRLDEGGVVYPIPGRRAFVLLNLRHHVFVWLAPLVLILGWSETVQILTPLLAGRSGAFEFLGDDGTRALVNVALEIVGVALVFLVLGPLAMRYVWDTVKLAPGPLRERLLALCRRHRVRVSDVLVWRTHGTMINGAVLGLTPAFRYVLLTDALLDSLPDDQVEAVMAHEVAHVRHRHIIWLAVVLAVSVAAFAAIAEVAVRIAGPGADDADIPQELALAIAAGSFVIAMFIFGLVSRRFEWQADAFAAAHMSERLRLLGPIEPAPPVVTHDGAAAMAGALRSVARLNHIALDRPSWRHGSIGSRLERLSSIIGRPVTSLPVNAAARAIKIAAILALVSLLLLGALPFVLGA